MVRKLAILAAAVAIGTPALANDTMAELKTGGLVYVESPDVSMDKEDLFISPQEVRVDYQFQNASDKDVETLVAFPMPDVQGQIDGDVAIADSDSDNFLDFTVTQDDQTITPTLQQRVISTGIDVTDDLTAQKIPLMPFSDKTYAALDKLPDNIKADWLTRGLVYSDEYDVGKGMEKHLTPLWTLRSTFWWRTKFPAGKTITVHHRYKPSVGGTVAISFLEDGAAKGERYDDYKRRFCIDSGFTESAQKLSKATESGGLNYTESWISYVLKTGSNWFGPIKHFKLTVDKGDAKNLISFCGSNVKKTGPTRFEMAAEDFYPTQDLDILILNAPQE